jgi:hypothetical protein
MSAGQDLPGHIAIQDWYFGMLIYERRGAVSPQLARREFGAKLKGLSDDELQAKIDEWSAHYQEHRAWFDSAYGRYPVLPESLEQLEICV